MLRMNEKITNVTDLFCQSIDKMKTMVDVSVVVGKMMNFNGISVLPVSKVKCGFISGGINQKKEEGEDNPFGGAAGGTMTLTPVAFLLILPNEVKVLHLDESSHILENLIDLIPDFIQDVMSLIKKEK